MPMTHKKPEEILPRLFAAPASLSPEHRDALESRLLARFAEIHPNEENPMPARHAIPFLRLAIAAAMVAGLGFALQAPAQYAVRLGAAIDLGLAGDGMPDPEAIVQALTAGANDVQVGARRKVGPDGAPSLHLDLWGTTVA